MFIILTILLLTGNNIDINININIYLLKYKIKSINKLNILIFLLLFYSDSFPSSS